MTKALEIYEMLTKQAAMCPGVWSALNVTKVDLVNALAIGANLPSTISSNYPNPPSLC